MTSLAEERAAREQRTQHAIAATQIRMSALIELALHMAQRTNTSGNETDIRARARADLRNAVARLECEA